MDTIQTLRKRIHTTEELQSIVKTMKSLSAASINQYDRAVAAVSEYRKAIELGLQIVFKNHLPERQEQSDKSLRTAIILFGSDYGLCGRFNDQVVDFATSTISQGAVNSDPVRWLICGVKAAMRLEANGVVADQVYTLPGSVAGLSEKVGDILGQLDEWRNQDLVDQAILFYNHRGQSSAVDPVSKHLWPADYEYLRALSLLPWESRNIPMVTMRRPALLSSLIRQHLFVITFQAGAQSMAAEHAARLSAMQGAERNISETLQDMNADFRRVRQDAITTELIDIISGYQAIQPG